VKCRATRTITREHGAEEINIGEIARRVVDDFEVLNLLSSGCCPVGLKPRPFKSQCVINSFRETFLATLTAALLKSGGHRSKEQINLTAHTSGRTKSLAQFTRKILIYS
jgi:hypothetical protein